MIVLRFLVLGALGAVVLGGWSYLCFETGRQMKRRETARVRAAAAALVDAARHSVATNQLGYAPTSKWTAHEGLAAALDQWDLADK